ncbi:oligosaccharide flippase family protein [Providencia rustigianii]|uniref:oligosaccharide flippase family protein n=1 Tax=Providencia rustigianii TaxID=158850 RepID=UPI000F6C499A|nr:oligosaccharide flippase family protein [Providencia rustigianii]MTC60660.1 oligosaccharide flippase family protein [Providencia rustigianii]VEH57125.1 Polysaccharide biosynthesis protein [Providencia rustigianii]
MNNKLFSFLLGNIGVFGIRFFYFIILTFTLSVQELASFTTSISICSIILCLCTYGSYNLFMRRKAKGEDGKIIIGEYLISSLIFLIIVTFTLCIIFLFIDISIKPSDLIIILISEYSFTAIPGIFKSYALSEYDKNIFIDSVTNIISSCVLTISSLFLLYLEKDNLYSTWVNIYFIVSIISILFRLFIWRNKISFPPFLSIPNLILAQIKLGHSFMISSVFRNAYLNVDKILIYSIFGKEIAGWYAISYRFFNVFLMLLNSISSVKEAKLYQFAEESKAKLNIEFKEIQYLTIKYYFYSIPFWFITAIGLYFYYPIECVYIFISFFFLCPLQLLSLSKLNLLNSISLERYRLIFMILGFLLNVLVSFILSIYLTWPAIVIGLSVSSLAILVPGYFLFNRKYLSP